tara:strand:+ start:989 stop:1408 length:420 start_codon:yes stop_codon:yes gene_type:complete
MISDVRDYLKARLKEEFTTAKEHKDAFNDDNISLPKSGVKFFIEYANSSNVSTDGNVVDDEIEATVKIFVKGFRDVQKALDDNMDKAHNFKLRASNKARHTSGIKNVVCDSIEAVEVESNDNIIVIEMAFSIRMIFAVI